MASTGPEHSIVMNQGVVVKRIGSNEQVDAAMTVLATKAVTGTVKHR